MCIKCDTKLKETFNYVAKVKSIQARLYNFVDRKAPEEPQVKCEIEAQSEDEQENFIEPSLQPTLFDSFEFLKLMNAKKGDDLFVESIPEEVSSKVKAFTAKSENLSVKSKPREVPTKANAFAASTKVRKLTTGKFRGKNDKKEMCPECGILVSSKYRLREHIAW